VCEQEPEHADEVDEDPPLVHRSNSSISTGRGGF
jgi:hypothetical protein